MKPKLSHADLVYRIRLSVLLLEIALPFVLYYALQSGHNWLAMLCLAVIVLGLIGVIIIQ